MAGILANDFKAIKLLGNVAAGQDGTAVAGDAIDARGFDRALFMIDLGAVTATGVLAFKVQECSASAGTYADIGGADIGAAGMVLTGHSDKKIVVDAPVKDGYLKVVYQRTTANIEIDALNVFLYNPKKYPANKGGALVKEVIA